MHELIDPGDADGAVAGECRNGPAVAIVNDRFVAVAHQAAGDVAAHSPKPIKPICIAPLRSRQRPLDRGTEIGKPGFHIAFEMHA